MKKIYKYILIITIMMFGFIGEVRAETDSVCVYNAKDGDKIEIRFSTAGVNEYDIFVNNVYIQKFTTWESGSFDEMTRKCPQNVYKGSSFINSGYCFDDDNTTDSTEGYCDKKFGSKKKLIELTDEVKNEFVEDNKYSVFIPPSAKTGDRCENSDKCAPICYYSFSVRGKKHDATIYYNKGKNIKNRYEVSASWIDSKRKKSLKTFNFYTSEAFISNSALLKLMDDGVCPANIYKDNDGNDQVCFDNAGECRTQSKFKDHEMQDAETSFFEKKEDYLKDIKEDRKNELSCEVAKEKIASEKGLNNITEICGYTRINTSSNDTNQFFVVTSDNKFKFYKYTANDGSFVEIDNTKDKNNIVYEKAYTCTSFKQFYTSDIDDNSQWRTDEDVWKKDNMFLFTCNVGSPMGYDKIENNATSCETLLGDDLRNEINSWFLYIKIAVPIILIVMGSLDFGKAFISSDEDAMKKAQKKFIMRLIIAIIIFFIPTIVNALLNIGDQVWNISNGNGTCEIKF